MDTSAPDRSSIDTSCRKRLQFVTVHHVTLLGELKLTTHKPAISELENTVMAVVWRLGRATADAVRTELKPNRLLRDSTVRTILRRLEEKGYVRHESVGRTYVYSPVDASQIVAADAVRALIDRLCNGSVETLLVGLVDREVVSSEKLQELAKRIAADKTRHPAASKNRTKRRKGS
jgi:BlaI family transcriptional regulator, penicillinase repressor